MKIAGVYSFNNGVDVVKGEYPVLLSEVENCISNIDASLCKTKISKEKAMQGESLYSPIDLNKKFKENLYPQGWESVRVECDYSEKYYMPDYSPKNCVKGLFVK